VCSAFQDADFRGTDECDLCYNISQHIYSPNICDKGWLITMQLYFILFIALSSFFYTCDRREKMRGRDNPRLPGTSVSDINIIQSSGSVH
jgi:hypothetical protein